MTFYNICVLWLELLKKKLLMEKHDIYSWYESDIKSKLKNIRETHLNYDWDELFIAKLILKDHSFTSNDFIIDILSEPSLSIEIKKYIVSTLPGKSLEFMSNFLSYKGANLLKEKNSNNLSKSKIGLYEKKINSKNIWNIEKDGDKKSIVLYLRYGDTNENFDNILLEIVEKVRLKIRSWESIFEKVVIVFRHSDIYDERLLNLVKKWDDTIKFAFVMWNDFKALINSPNRSVVYFSNWTPEWLLNNSNWTSIICETINKRFNLRWIWKYNYVPLPWSACDDKVIDEYPYVEIFMKCLDKLEPSLKEKTIQKVFDILKLAVNY